jgi:two-component system, chemotaxis family, CheB/CheR fusion protein
MTGRRSLARTGPKRVRRQGAPEKHIFAAGEINFPVVAIGASAGGIDASRALLAVLPARSGLAFILVMHLDPTHPSRLAELLSAHTAMTVLEAGEGMPLRPDHVYVIPPGRLLALHDGALRLSAAAKSPTIRMPFDFLLRSLAEEIGERAVCIVLSGTASDGSAGAKAIKEAGGLVIVQNPEEAQYDGMPRSAIATGAVDLVLPVAKMPEVLARYASHSYVRTGKSDAKHIARERVAKIVELLHKKTPHDFALYKEGTLARRIERRMAMVGIDDGDRYLELLTRDPAELQRLASDLLINVTRFFRDTNVFELLRAKIVPELVHAHPKDAPIRIWVPGCSTGEEAYSIAMLFFEEIEASQRNIKLQIFATDIDEDAIQQARDGLYPASIEADVSPARLARFFSTEDGRYRVSRGLRAPVILSVHDLTRDAPFSRLDLISCRNLLIYLRPEAQQKALAVFHFALREGGYLVLGTSESVGDANDHFEPILKKERIYRHLGRARADELTLPFGRGEATRSLWIRPVRPAARPRAQIGESAQRLLLDAFAPASVLLNRKHQGLYYFGPTDRYLKMPAGRASQDLLASAREGLRPAIRNALEQLREGQELKRTVSLISRMKRNGSEVAVTVSARRVEMDGEQMILVSFVDAPERKTVVAAELPADASRIAQVEQELDMTRRDLEIAIRDRETAEEEVRAINEEAMSANEEFQTTNEELETSKEELQSLNEELMALNSQLQTTADQSAVVANDLANILNSTLVATLFLDEKLNIRFFTPEAKVVFNIIATDIGRPLSDLTHNFTDGSLYTDARAVLANLVPVTREFSSKGGNWYSCRITPYRTSSNRIEGVVLSFNNITERKRLEEAWDIARKQAESANLGKSRFLAAGSHDLRQPLQTLSFLQALLAMKLTDVEQLQIVKLCEESVAAMAGLLNTLLDINQLEAGVIRPNATNFRIDDILKHMKAEFAYHTQTKGLDWRVVRCRLAVRSDPRLLEEIIRNLLSNAVKYTKKGRILLGCRRRKDKLCIEVWDTGVGIPEAQQQAIFEEFHQIDNPSRERSKGLGLGLAIVQRLGDLMGHTIDVRSCVGRGSIFSIEVPLAPKGAALPPQKRESKELAARSGTILIVEDDPELRFSLDLLLRSTGHRTMVAADAEEAIKLIGHENLQPDIAVIDYDLPMGTGLEVMKRLRETIGHDLPALVLTGDISTEALKAISAQGYRYHSKPIGAEDLKSLINALLAERPRPRSSKRVG